MFDEIFKEIPIVITDDDRRANQHKENIRLAAELRAMKEEVSALKKNNKSNNKVNKKNK